MKDESVFNTVSPHAQQGFSQKSLLYKCSVMYCIFSDLSFIRSLLAGKESNCCGNWINPLKMAHFSFYS